MSGSGVSDSGSWIYLTNHTPNRESLKSGNSCLDKETKDKLEKQIGQVGMTRDPDRVCREETFTDTEVLSWYDMVNSFEKYVEDKKGLSHVLENQEEERLYIDNSHRFEKEYKKKQQAKFYSVENKALENYGEEGLTTVMLTLSASPFKDGQLLPPIDHLDSLLDPDKGSWASVRTAISRVLSEYEYEYMRILEPHTPNSGSYASSGYAHSHIALLVNDPDDSIEAQDFEPVLDSHIQNCETAGKSAHTVNNSVSVTPYDPSSEGGVGAYLTAYMGKTIDEEVQEADRWFKRFLSLLWASNRRRVGFSNGANEWAKEDYEEKYNIEDSSDSEESENEGSEWEYIGIKKNEDEEVIECSNGGGSGYTTTMPAHRDQMFIDVSNIWNSPID